MVVPKMSFYILSLFASLCALYSHSSADSQSLTLPSGKIEGILKESDVLKRKFSAFYSIPYAKPPVGDLRFKAPVLAEPWEGTLMATELPPMCPQLDIFHPEAKNCVGSEDCLYLNVFTPQLLDKNSRLLEVLVVIHGGGFTVSSGNHVAVEKLMDKDVVVVTMNYRLGALGFLSTEDEASPGNNGLKDQNLALRWTKENIAYFGGDPQKITISGCSAGGASVHYHLLSATSKGLFQKAIPESGSALNPWAFVDNAKTKARKLATDLGCPTKCTKEMVDCLRGRPADHIILKQNWNIFALNPEFQFLPSVEPPSSDAFLDKHPREVMANGEAIDVPILSSFSKDEGLLFLMSVIGDSDRLKEMEDKWEDRVVPLLTEEELPKARRKDIAEALKKRYLKGKSIIENKAGLVKMMGDWGFNAGVEEFSKMLANTNKSPVYSYHFKYRGKINSTLLSIPEDAYKGAVNHCDQSMYVTPFAGCKVSNDEPMSEVLLNLMMNFIKGEPLAKNWRTVKDGLPKYSLFEISSADWENNEMKTFDDFSNVELWKSLRTKISDVHSEL